MIERTESTAASSGAWLANVLDILEMGSTYLSTINFWTEIGLTLSFGLTIMVIASGLLQNLINTIQLALAFKEMRENPPLHRSLDMWRTLTSDVSLPMSILVPAFNEEKTLVENISSILSLHFPSFEVVVINDGSTDGTLEAAIKAFNLKPIVRSFDPAVSHQPIRGIYGSPDLPRLIVVDKENGGKSDALNAGINLSRFPLFCSIDADSILEADSLLRTTQAFNDDPTTVAIGGTIRIANGCKVRAGRVVEVNLPRTLLPLFQTIEYLRAFLIARLAWSHLGALLLISGAFGVFKRQAVIDVGGYTHGTVGEDLEIIMKIHRRMCEQKRPYKVHFVPDPVCWTEAPANLGDLARQRMRWQRGALEGFFRHTKMLFNPRYKAVGMLGLPNMLFVDVLGPPIELLGYLLIPLFWGLGILSLDYFMAFIALTFIFGIFISLGSLILEEIEIRRYPNTSSLLILTLVAVVENFGYRQINNIWRIMGFWQFLRKTKGWGKMQRAGFLKS